LQAIAEKFLTGELPVDRFLKDFLEKKTLAHTRSLLFSLA
jgi:hypothetical protein